MSLAADHIQFGYHRHTPIFGDLSLEVRPGEVLALLGPNGSGKTTLLRLLAGMLRPVAGTITIDGLHTHALKAHDRARRLAFVPQNPALAFPFDLARYVGFGRFALGSRDRPKLVHQAIDRLDLTNKTHEPIGELSAGQRQRAAIARALCQLGESAQTPGTCVLLADEPTASLDPKHAVRVMELMRELASTGVAVAVVIHDLSSASRWADRAALLDSSGSLIAEGSPESVLSDQALRQAFGIGFERIQARGELLALRPVASR